jgi:hypothetical protein
MIRFSLGSHLILRRFFPLATASATTGKSIIERNRKNHETSLATARSLDERADVEHLLTEARVITSHRAVFTSQEMAEIGIDPAETFFRRAAVAIILEHLNVRP